MKWKFMKDTYTYIHTQIFTFTYSYADVKTDNTKKLTQDKLPFVTAAINIVFM